MDNKDLAKEAVLSCLEKTEEMLREGKVSVEGVLIENGIASVSMNFNVRWNYGSDTLTVTFLDNAR